MKDKLEMQYALIFDGTDRNEILTGTAEDIGEDYLLTIGADLKVDIDEDGYLGYFIRFTKDEEDWEEYDGLDDQGSVEDNLKAAHAAFFLDFLHGAEEEDFRTFDLDTPEKVALFEWTHDELLDHITLREARDAGLDYEEEFDFETRCWYYDNKLQPAKSVESKAA